MIFLFSIAIRSYWITRKRSSPCALEKVVIGESEIYTYIYVRTYVYVASSPGPSLFVSQAGRARGPGMRRHARDAKGRLNLIERGQDKIIRASMPTREFFNARDIQAQA